MLGGLVVLGVVVGLVGGIIVMGLYNMVNAERYKWIWNIDVFVYDGKEKLVL